MAARIWYCAVVIDASKLGVPYYNGLNVYYAETSPKSGEWLVYVGYGRAAVLLSTADVKQAIKITRNKQNKPRPAQYQTNIETVYQEFGQHTVLLQLSNQKGETA